MFYVTGHQIKCEGLQIRIIISKLGPTFVQQYWWSVLCGGVQLHCIPWMRAMLCFSL